jgi:formylglycine-generating enzyme required for sulfatase activity
LIQKSEVTIAQMEVAIASDTNIASTNNVSYWKAQVGSKAPAANITWAEAAKYCNWMTTGDAYNGAYQFDQYGNLTNVLSRDEIRLKGRIHYVLPTENEWYKAAYGSNGTWSLHVNGTSTAPSSGTNANWKSVVGRVWRTYVDVLPAGYKEQNGTYDMAGNVREMTESAYSGTVYTNLTAERVVRGGAHNSATATSISSVQRDQFTYGIRNTNVGFRTAIIIPERLDLE